MALSEREIAYIISAKDEASVMFQRINQAAEKSGQSIKQVMDETSLALDKAGKSTNRLTSFIREQRQENRMQNFLFREGAGAIATFATGLTMLSSTAGAAGESTKQLSNALNAGFTAFQSFDFLLAGIGVTGGLGLVIAGLAAAATAVMAFTKAAEESTAKLDAMNLSIKEQEYRLGMLSKAQMMEAYTAALARAYKDQERLNNLTTDWWESIKRILVPMASIQRGMIVQKIVGSPEELAGAQKAINDIFLAIQAFQEKEEKRQRKGEDSGDLMANIRDLQKRSPMLLNVLSTLKTHGDKLWDSWGTKTKTIGSHVKEIAFQFNESVLQIGVAWNSLFGSMQAGIGTVANDIAAWWSSAFDRAFGIGHTLLGRFFNAVTSYIAQLAAQLAAAAAVAGILSMFGLPFAATFPLLSGGLSGIFNSAPRPATTQVGGTESSQARGGIGMVNINILSPVPHGEWIKQSVEEGMRKTGLAVDRYFQNKGQDLALSF